jgi:hypothetical protein
MVRRFDFNFQPIGGRILLANNDVGSIRFVLCVYYPTNFKVTKQSTTLIHVLRLVFCYFNICWDGNICFSAVGCRDFSSSD